MQFHPQMLQCQTCWNLKEKYYLRISIYIKSYEKGSRNW